MASREGAEPVPLMKQLLAGGGLMTFFLVYGVLQERIMTIPWGEAEEMFSSSAFLVLNNRVVAIMMSLTILLYTKQTLAPAAPLNKYFGIAISNTGATFCQYEALKYVSFPTQTLGKCAKMFPILIISYVLKLRSYTARDYVIAAIITISCTIFILGGDVSARGGSPDDSFFGILLLLGFLFLDGFTSTFQEKIFKDHKGSSYNQMFYNNIASAILSILALIYTHQFWYSIEFCMRHPDFAIAAFGLSLAAAGGQIIIYYTIRNLGALFFSMCMVTRQVVSILISCLLFLHPLTSFQWLSAAIVFFTIYYEKAVKPPPSHAPPSASPPSPKEEV